MHRKSEVALQIAEHDEHRAATHFPGSSVNTRAVANTIGYYSNDQRKIPLFSLVFSNAKAIVTMATVANMSIVVECASFIGNSSKFLPCFGSGTFFV